MPDGSVSTTFVIRPDEQLGLLQIGRQVNSAQFASAYQSFAANFAALASIPVLVDAADVRDSYFKFNLDAINLFSLIRLETDSKLLRSYQSTYQIFRSAIENHMNAHFNMIDRASQRRKLHARSGDCILSHSMAAPAPPRFLRGSARPISLLRQLRRILRSFAHRVARHTRISYGSGVRSSWTAAALA